MPQDFNKKRAYENVKSVLIYVRGAKKTFNINILYILKKCILRTSKVKISGTVTTIGEIWLIFIDFSGIRGPNEVPEWGMCLKGGRVRALVWYIKGRIG